MDPQSLTDLLEQFFASYGASQPILTGSVAVDLFVVSVQWAAIILSAIGGVYEARRRDLDFSGAIAIAVAVSFGGGTLRDLLLGRTPLFWITSPVYIVTVFVVAVFAQFVITRGAHVTGIQATVIKPMWQVLRSNEMPFWLITLDALSLGLWAYLGTSIALSKGSAWLVAPALGVITASFGGVIRDVFFAQIPSVFKRGQLYAVCAFLGSIVYVLVYGFTSNQVIGFALCVLVTFVTRMAAVRYNIVSQ